MNKYSFSAALLLMGVCAIAQPAREHAHELTLVKKIEHTPVKSQANTGTCWSFSTTSLIESEAIRENLGAFDLSEMFIVRKIYVEKARNYVLRQGKAQFGSGGLGHDVINAIASFGAMPEAAYSGLLLGQKDHDHVKLDNKLKQYLDSVLAHRPVQRDWLAGVESILDDHLGRVPEQFTYKERVYTPQTFASDVLKFNREDYVFVTSFSHHPFYRPFVLEIPDNYGNESYYNIPLEEMIALVKDAVAKGYSIMWDADVSNSGFRQGDGFAMLWPDPKGISKPIDPDSPERKWDQAIRQELFENLTTQDDHLMHLVGVEKSKEGKTFFLVKNSWGEVGPYKGYIKVSESYFAINTISLVVPKAALGSSLRSRLNLK